MAILAIFDAILGQDRPAAVGEKIRFRDPKAIYEHVGNGQLKRLRFPKKKNAAKARRASRRAHLLEQERGRARAKR